MKRRRIYFYLSILITSGMLALTFTLFFPAFRSLANSAVEFYNAVIMYFSFVFLLRLPQESPINPPNIDIGYLPNSGGEFVANLGQWWNALWTADNFNAYLYMMGDWLMFILRILPFIILFWILMRKYLSGTFRKHNNKYNEDTKPLKVFKTISDKSYVPISDFVKQYVDYLKHSRFITLWKLIWIFNFNIIAIMFGVMAIVLYFFISFDFVALYYFVFNTVVLALPAIRIIPIWVWVVLLLVMIDRWRKKVAMNNLRHMEAMNKGFVNERSICGMLVGTMGKGKTTLVTDMALSIETIFRTKAKELMLECDMMFPHFP